MKEKTKAKKVTKITDNKNRITDEELNNILTPKETDSKNYDKILDKILVPPHIKAEHVAEHVANHQATQNDKEKYAAYFNSLMKEIDIELNSGNQSTGSNTESILLTNKIKDIIPISRNEIDSLFKIDLNKLHSRINLLQSRNNAIEYNKKLKTKLKKFFFNFAKHCCNFTLGTNFNAVPVTEKKIIEHQEKTNQEALKEFETWTKSKINNHQLRDVIDSIGYYQISDNILKSTRYQDRADYIFKPTLKTRSVDVCPINRRDPSSITAVKHNTVDPLNPRGKAIYRDGQEISREEYLKSLKKSNNKSKTKKASPSKKAKQKSKRKK